MTTHDEMCPWSTGVPMPGDPPCPWCKLIAKVREDQDRRNAEAEGVKAYLVTEKVEALLEQAKRDRDALYVSDMRDDPFAYGSHMHAGGRVVGIAEALQEMQP